jgi:hypothetical protein
MRALIRIALAIALLATAEVPASASDRVARMNLPSIGLGAINRVPCDLWESQTPVPFVGSTKDLLRLCPGALSVQLYRMRAQLARRRACYFQWYASNGTLMRDRRCLGHERRLGRGRRWGLEQRWERGLRPGLSTGGLAR